MCARRIPERFRSGTVAGFAHDDASDHAGRFMRLAEIVVDPRNRETMLEGRAALRVGRQENGRVPRLRGRGNPQLMVVVVRVVGGDRVEAIDLHPAHRVASGDVDTGRLEIRRAGGRLHQPDLQRAACRRRGGDQHRCTGEARPQQHADGTDRYCPGCCWLQLRRRCGLDAHCVYFISSFTAAGLISHWTM